MRILALLAALPIVAAIQINPEYWYNYEIPGPRATPRRGAVAPFKTLLTVQHCV